MDLVTAAKQRAHVHAVVDGRQVVAELVFFPIPPAKRRPSARPYNRPRSKACVVVGGRHYRIPPGDVLGLVDQEVST